MAKAEIIKSDIKISLELSGEEAMLICAVVGRCYGPMDTPRKHADSVHVSLHDIACKNPELSQMLRDNLESLGFAQRLKFS